MNKKLLLAFSLALTSAYITSKTPEVNVYVIKDANTSLENFNELSLPVRASCRYILQVLINASNESLEVLIGMIDNFKAFFSLFGSEKYIIKFLKDTMHAAIQNSNGDMKKAHALFRDALKEAEAKLSATFDSVPVKAIEQETKKKESFGKRIKNIFVRSK